VFFPTVADGGVIRATREKMIMGRPAAASQYRGPFQVDEDVALAELEQERAARSGRFGPQPGPRYRTTMFDL
jgi:hypothetical protein